MEVLVQKFGGTSVQTAENRIHVINHIKDGIDSNYKIVVVVSGLGRKPDPYATDTLLDLVSFTALYNSNRELDLLMSCGQSMSCVLLWDDLDRHYMASIA